MSLNIQNNVSMPKNQMAFKAKGGKEVYEAIDAWQNLKYNNIIGILC